MHVLKKSFFKKFEDLKEKCLLMSRQEGANTIGKHKKKQARKFNSSKRNEKVNLSSPFFWIKFIQKSYYNNLNASSASLHKV